MNTFVQLYKNATITKKLLINIFVLIIIFAVIIVGFSLYNFNSLTDEIYLKDANTSLELLENESEKMKEQSKDMAVLLSKNQQIISAVETKDKRELLAKVNSVISGLKIDFITITDENGNVIARTHDPEKSGDNVSNQYNIKEALSGKIVPVIEQGTVVKLSARTGAPVYNDSGNLIGVISTGYSIDNLEIVDKLKALTGNEFTFFLGDTRISTSIVVNGQRAVGTQLDPAIAEIVIRQGRNFNGRTDILGIPHVTAYKPLRDANNNVMGVFFSGAPVANVQEANNKLLTLIIIISFAFLLVLGFISSFVINIIIGKPIKELTNVANKLAVGDVNVKVESNSNDEIGILQKSFTEMINGIKEKARASEQIANGDLNINLTSKSKEDILSTSIIMVVERLRELISELSHLTSEAVKGNLKARGKADKFNGSYKEIVEGVNELIEKMVEPIDESKQVLNIMSRGDLTPRVTGDYKGDFKQLKDSINTVGESLSKALSDVTEAVQATASAANQISSSSEEMAAGAHEQTQQATEVAGAVEEMTKTILESTKNAGLAADTSKQQKLMAEEGKGKVEQTKKGMERIVSSARQTGEKINTLAIMTEQIGDIAQVIDDIADQTNLLALNAAIEAARAGEQGRGFAVVADEVRKLAERTTKATKEIAETIKAVQKEAKDADASMIEAGNAVEEGNRLTVEVADSLQDILIGADRVSDIVGQVAAASEEQSAASEQISKNIEGISSVTQQSAAGTQQIARAAEDLNRLTLNLQELIGRFKIDSNESTKQKSKVSAYQMYN